MATSEERAALTLPHWPRASLTVLIGIAYGCWYLIAFPSDHFGRYLSAAFVLIAAAASTYACLRLGRAANAAGTPWLWFSAGCASWCLGTLLWFVSEPQRLGRPDTYSVAAVAEFSFAVCFSAGVLALVRANDPRYPVREVVIDSLIVIVVFAALGYELFLDSRVDPSDHDLKIFAIGWSWTIAILILLGIAVVSSIFTARGPDRVAFALLLAGLALFAAADVRYVWSVVNGETTFANAVDLGWQTALLLFAAAALRTTVVRAPRGMAIVVSRNYLRGRLFLGITGVLSATALAVYATTQPRDSLTVFAVVACGLLLALRLGLASRNSDRLMDRTRERDRLAAVVEMSSAVAGTLDEEQVLARLASVSAQAVGCDRAAVTLVSLDGGFDRIVTHGLSDKELALLHEADGPRVVFKTTWRWSIAGRTMAVRWGEVQAVPAVAAEAFRDIGKRQSLITPLLARHEALGFVELWRSGETGRFDNEDAVAAAAIARQGGLALRNARLHAEAQVNAEERAMLLRVSQAATSTLELRPMLAEVARTTLGIASAEACWIELWHPLTREFEVVAAETDPTWPGTDPAGTRYPVDQRTSVRLVLEQGSPMIFTVPDPCFTEPELKDLVDNDVQSVLFVPLMTGGVCVGEMRLFSRRAQAFGPHELRFSQDIGGHISLAIHNALLMEETQRRVEEQALRLRVSQAATSSLELQTVLDEISDAVLTIPGVESCGIELWHPDTDDLETRSEATTPDWEVNGDTGRRFPVGFWASDRAALQSKDPLCFELDDPGLSDRERSDMTTTGVASMVRYPLLIGSDCLGLLNIYSRRPRAFSPDARRLAQDLAAQTALAIHNAQLLEDARRLAMDQSGLLRVSQAIISNHELKTVLREVARASRGLAGAECCEIELWYPETDETLLIAQEYVEDWLGPDHSGSRLSLADWPTSKRVIVEQQPLAFDADADFLTPKERDIFSSYDTRSVLIVPLLIDNGCVGIISFYARRASAFPPRAVRIGQDLASQAALAIERARLHEALKERALTDGLTGLLNQRSILEVVDAELARSRRDDCPVAVLMIDLDNFKQVNDRHGHLVGDGVLRNVSAILQTSVREPDHVGRYGGDEFLVLLHATTLPEAQEVAVRIWRRIEREAFSGYGVRVPVRLSIGIASAPEHGITRQELIAVADAAMYMAKQRMMPVTDELVARERADV
ncbi:MAG: diguanylate cyclase [Thermomicrobiales bacterium]